MKVTLTYPEVDLLQYALELYYEIYAKPPFKDVDDRYMSVMDIGQDFQEAASRIDERQDAIEKDDILAELGMNDDPNSPSYLSQLVKAEFFAVSAVVRRWFNGLQYSLYAKGRFMTDQEKILSDYWARDNAPRVLILYDSLAQEAGAELVLQHDAVLDIRAITHLLCHFSQTVTPELVRLRAKEAAEAVATTEERVTEDEIFNRIQEAEKRYHGFASSIKSLVEKLIEGYRMDKFGVKK